MTKLELKHPLVIRWTHWINFPILSLMIWSGILIYWSNDVYRFGFFHFFPNWFYKSFNIDHRLSLGMAIHFFLMWIFALNGIAYILYTLFSGEWRYLFPDRNSFREAIAVTLHDLGIRKQAPPQLRYNGAQKIAYTAIVLMGAGSLLTGLAIYRPIQVHWLTSLLGGYPMARWEHFWLTIGYCGFFLIHVGQVIRAGWNNFRSMVTGYDLVRIEEIPGD